MITIIEGYGGEPTELKEKPSVTDGVTMREDIKTDARGSSAPFARCVAEDSTDDDTGSKPTFRHFVR